MKSAEREEGGTRGAAAAAGSPPAARSPSRAPAWRTLLTIPNQLTIARLFLSFLFFVLLALGGPGKERVLLLNTALVVFVLAVSTDILDGYLARKWQLASTFGRIADPFVDKIVICGGFIMLTGVAPELVRPWYAVLIIFREFLVSGLRSFLESRGVAFGAVLSGKLKMILQSVTIPVVIFYEGNFAVEAERGTTLEAFFYWLTVAFLAATLVLTLGSCVGYVRRAVRLLRS